MATENDDSRSMNGILSNISRDVVDTSWDIPPLTFPKLQPTDSEEADGADEASLAEPPHHRFLRACANGTAGFGCANNRGYSQCAARYRRFR